MGWVIGASLSILGSIASNLGVNIQKYSFIRQSQREPHQRTTHWKDIYWLSGLGLVIFGSLGDFAALSMVAQSIVAPLASTTLVTNVVFAHFWLHESVGKRELAGTFLIILGSTLAVVFGDHKQRQYTDSDLVSLIGGGWFLTYAVLVFILCAMGLALHRKITPIKKNLVDAIRRYELTVAANDAQGADLEDEVIARLEAEYKRWEKIHPFALCALSGAFGAQSVLFGKCFAELLSTTIQGDNQMFHVFPYVALVCMGITVASQLHFLAVALNYFDALYAVPVFQCFFIGVSTLGGALYFREVYAFSAGDAVAFVFGLLMTLGGVAILSTRKMSQRNIVHKVAASGEAAALVPTTGSINAGQPLTDSAIPEGDEEAGDEGVVSSEISLLHKRSIGSNASSSRSGSFGSPDDKHKTVGASSGPKEFEMSDIGAKRASMSIPVLKSSAALGNFSEKAENEAREVTELAHTIEGAQGELAAKLAAAGYGAGASSGSEPLPLLHPSPAQPITPALAIQIEADQAYINRQAELAAAAAAGASRKPGKTGSVVTTRDESDLDILNLKSLKEDGSPRKPNATIRSGSFHEGPSASGGSSRAETPRSAYVQERERAASVAGGPPSASGRSSPASSGDETPSRMEGSPTFDAANPAGHVRTMSQIGLPPGVASPKVRMPSAIFSGAILDSAQKLPDVASDDKIQRLTRLSTVGHWVAGLHAQMPVVGGVAQAILQAKEMQTLIDEEVSKEKREKIAAAATLEDMVEERIDIDKPVPVGTAIELTDFPKPAGSSTAGTPQQAEKSASSSTKTTPNAPAPSDATSSSSSTSSASSSSTAPSIANASVLSINTIPAVEPVIPTNRVIQFDDSYDPFTTQAGFGKGPDAFARRQQREEELLASPTSAFAALRKQNSLTSGPAASEITSTPEKPAAEVAKALADKANEKVVFSPLAVTTRHPLQDGAAPTPQPDALEARSPVASAGNASSPVARSPILPIAASMPVLPPVPGSAPRTKSDGAGEPGPTSADVSVEEWAAALRIQSLYRGAKIRRSLRDSDQLTKAQKEKLVAPYDENNDYVAVDPVLPQDAKANSTVATTTPGADPAQIEREWQDLAEQHQKEQDQPEELNLQ